MDDQIMISENALLYLRSTRPWVMFLAVLGFIGTAFMVLASLFMFAGAALPLHAKTSPTLYLMFGIVYLLMTLFFCLIPAILLVRYSSAISRIPLSGQGALEDAIASQKTFWKYMGIFTIVWLVLDVFIMFFEFKYGLFHGPH
jgi:hypothetical protein